MEEMAARVKTEQEGQEVAALVYGGGGLERKLAEMLSGQKLVVTSLRWGEKIHERMALPRYVYLFINEARSFGEIWREMADLVRKAGARLVVVLENLEGQAAREVEEKIRGEGFPMTIVEVRGRLTDDEATIAEAALKLVRLGLAGRGEEKAIIIGKGGSRREELVVGEKTTSVVAPSVSGLFQGQEEPSEKIKIKWEEVKPIGRELEAKKGGGRRGLLLKIILGLVGVVVVCLLTVGVLAVVGVLGLRAAADGVGQGKVEEARRTAAVAEGAFGILAGGAEVLGLDGNNPFLIAVRMGKSGAEIIGQAAGLFGRAEELGMTIEEGGKGDGLERQSREISRGLRDLGNKIGLLRAVAEDRRQTLGLVTALGGNKEGKINEYLEEAANLQRLSLTGAKLVEVLPEIVGLKEKKNYLVVFQNSAELRPTGGFIGSYALVRLDEGKVVDFKIHDVYEADGQLKGRIAPPDEILHFLGQPNWYMRDANFGADFPLSAKRLEWFLEKETGEKADGVVGINLGAAEKILGAAGPVKVAGEEEEVTSENFFKRAEYAAEINFFPGSTQKRDFIGAVGQGLLEKLKEKSFDKKKMALAIWKAVREKDIMFYFDDGRIQGEVEGAEVAGAIMNGPCGEVKNNCLGVVEANFGANKADYYMKKQIETETILAKGGELNTKVRLTLKNDSPSESWPGGRYKDYVRFLIPNGSEIRKVDIGDGRTATLSAVLTAEVLAKVASDRFPVYVSSEPAVFGGVATSSAFKSVGVLVEVPVGEKRQVELDYSPGTKVNYKDREPVYQLNILKQPGNMTDEMKVKLEFPEFLKIGELAVNGRSRDVGGRSDGFGRVVVSDQGISYNGPLVSDQELKIRFKKDLK